MYNKIAQIDLTLLAMFVFVSCFPLASINVSEQVNIARLVSNLRRKRGIFFCIQKFLTKTQFYKHTHTVYVEKRLHKLFCQRDVTFLPKWRLRELPTAAGFSVM
jgi:hypothetical protein